MTAVIAPVKNPDSPPKYRAVMITIALTGLKKGTGAKINLPPTDSAVITEIITKVREAVFFFSKDAKNGTQARTAHKSETNP